MLRTCRYKRNFTPNSNKSPFLGHNIICLEHYNVNQLIKYPYHVHSCTLLKSRQCQRTVMLLGFGVFPVKISLRTHLLVRSGAQKSKLTIKRVRYSKPRQRLLSLNQRHRKHLINKALPIKLFLRPTICDLVGQPNKQFPLHLTTNSLFVPT